MRVCQEEDEELERAAVKIQAGFRGFKARKQIKYLKLPFSSLSLHNKHMRIGACRGTVLDKIQNTRIKCVSDKQYRVHLSI